jgi:hypothetical protein
MSSKKPLTIDQLRKQYSQMDQADLQKINQALRKSRARGMGKGEETSSCGEESSGTRKYILYVILVIAIIALAYGGMCAYKEHSKSSAYSKVSYYYF